MKPFSLIAVLMMVISGAAPARPALGQQSESAQASTADEGSAPGDSAADDVAPQTQSMTLEEIVAQAYESIEVAEARGPGAPEALLRTNQLVGAIRMQDPLNDDAEFLAGRVNLVSGRPREAIGLIRNYAASRKGANDWLAFKLLGDLYQQAKYYTLARDKYNVAIELNPRNPEPHAGLAWTELSLARAEQAVQAVQAAIELAKPERDPAHYALLAQAFAQDRKVDEASEAASTAVDIAREKARDDPTDPALLANLERYSLVLETIIQNIIANYPERTGEYARLIRTQKERAGIAHLRSLHAILYKIENDAQRLASDAPASLLLEQAKLLLDVGDEQKAAQVLTDLLAKDPDSAEARQLLAQLGVAEPGATPEP